MAKKASEAQRETIAILRRRNSEQQAIIRAYMETLEENIRLTGGDVAVDELDGNAFAGSDGFDDDGLDFWDEG